MRYINFILIVFLFSIWSCSSLSYKTDYDPAIDFSTYKTYMWYTGKMPADDALSANPLIKKRVEAGVDKALEAKGFTVGAEDAFDYVVIIHAGNKEKMQITNYGYSGYGYGRYGHGWGGYGGYSQTDVHQYDETTLVIDILDAKSKEMVWRGTATGIVKKYSDQEKMQEAINRVVEKMLTDFPPKK